MSWRDEAKKSASRRGSSSQQPQTSTDECQELLTVISGGDHPLNDQLHKVLSTDKEICAWLLKPSSYLLHETPAYFVRSMEFQPVLLALNTEYPDS